MDVVGPGGKEGRRGHVPLGRKQGPWRRWDTPDGRPAITYFSGGQPIDDLDALLARLAADLRGNEVRRRSRAAWELELLGDAAVPLLAEILQEGDCVQRLLASRTLQHIGPVAAAAAPALENAVRDERPRVQAAALLALAETDPARAKDAIGRLLQLATDGDSTHHDLAVACLVRAGPAGARQLAAAVSDPRQAIRLAAFDVTARMEHRHRWYPTVGDDPNVNGEDLAAVIREARNHPDPKIREMVKSLPYPWNAPGAHGRFLLRCRAGYRRESEAPAPRKTSGVGRALESSRLPESEAANSTASHSSRRPT